MAKPKPGVPDYKIKKTVAKPVAKKTVAKSKVSAKPKTKVTKSRGSNTAKQIGNDNQREWYNGIRQKAGGKIVNTSTDMTGQLLKVTQKEKNGRLRASSQRSGGKGK